MAEPSIGTVASAPGFAATRGRRAVETRLIAGAAQAVVWDLDSGERRPATDHPHGVELSELEPDGEFLWWFDAGPAGDGEWRRQPFVGGNQRPALLGVPAGRPRGVGFDQRGRLAAICVGVARRTLCFVGPPGGTGREVYAAAGYRCLVDVAPDGTVLALAGSPDGPDAIVLCDVRTGATTALGGDRDRRLWALEFRPVRDAAPRLLLMAETDSGFSVATWSAAAGLVSHSHLEFPTTASAGWYTDGRRVLVQHETAGRSRLLMAELDASGLQELPIPAGTVHDLSCAPDGSIHYLWSRADTPATLLTTAPDGSPATAPYQYPYPSGHGAPTRDLWTPTAYGEIHSLLTAPEGDPPWPTVFLVHGGPATHDRDCADPRVEALAGAGYAVVRTNYRGSTGYGPGWQHNFGHRVGLAQIEDLAAVRAQLLDDGLADGRTTALCGYSWGGYLALLAMGAQPQLWTAAAAAYPIADYVLSFAATTPELREVDVGLFGGTPDEVPQRYAAASPITYADRVRGPVLLIGATGDERCPPEQIEHYTRALRDRGVPHRTVWRDGGHAGRHLDEQSSIMALTIGFLRRELGGPSELPDAPAPGIPADHRRGG
jgi:dipeptidyl aminopeptidase/acylaminoacyl peptidase